MELRDFITELLESEMLNQEIDVIVECHEDRITLDDLEVRTYSRFTSIVIDLSEYAVIPVSEYNEMKEEIKELEDRLADYEGA